MFLNSKNGMIIRRVYQQTEKTEQKQKSTVKLFYQLFNEIIRNQQKTLRNVAFVFDGNWFDKLFARTVLRNLFEDRFKRPEIDETLFESFEEFIGQNRDDYYGDFKAIYDNEIEWRKLNVAK